VPEPAPLYPVNRLHLDEISDDIGIMQHAIGSRPDPAHGYCTDDVARSLQVDLLHQRELGWAAVGDSAWRSLRFIDAAFDGATGRFRNFRRADGSWLDAPGSEDCHGRAMLALGETIALAPDARLVESATSLFERALPEATTLTAIRARASVILGYAAILDAAPNPAAAAALRLMGTDLHARFRSVATFAWPWPESSLTYENGLPARALIVAGRALASDDMIDDGLRALDWLIDAQTTTDGCLSPIGNGWWPRGGTKSQFDQQPIEATALLLAAEVAWLETSNDRYRTAVERAHGWFLGENDLGLDVADPTRGGSRDGLTPGGVNTNQGAESTLMWLIATEHIRALRGSGPTGSAPVWVEPILATATP
jgi:hypothetical protein